MTNLPLPGAYLTANVCATRSYVRVSRCLALIQGISLIWAENVVSIFNTEPALVEITSTFLRMNIVVYMVFGMEMVLMNCLNGVGDTMIPMLTALIALWLVQMPLAYFMPRVTNLGVYGVRWAIITSEVVMAVTYAIYFKMGRWQRKRV